MAAYCEASKPQLTRDRISECFGPRREVRKTICSGGHCVRESPIWIGGPRCRKKTNDRLLNALAAVGGSRSVEELTADLHKPVTWSGRRMRGLRPCGEAQVLLAAVNHGEFLINGFRNRDLQKLLYATEAESPREGRRRPAVVSRILRLLRSHGLVTEAGRTVIVAVLTTARTTLHQPK